MELSKFTAMVALAFTAALGGSGCAMDTEDPTEEVAIDDSGAVAEESAAVEASPEEATGTASEALTSNDCGWGERCYDGGRRSWGRYDDRRDYYDWWRDRHGRYWNDDCRGRDYRYRCDDDDRDRYDRHHRNRRHRDHGRRGHDDHHGGWH